MDVKYFDLIDDYMVSGVISSYITKETNTDICHTGRGRKSYGYFCKET